MAHTVPAAYAHSAIRLLSRPREQLERLLRELGLPAELLEEHSATGEISAEQFGRLFIGLVRLAQRETESDADAADQVVNLSTYRLMFTYMLQAPDLRDAIRRATLFFLRFNDARQGFTLGVEGSVARWRFALPPADGRDARMRLEHFGMGKLHWLPGLHGRLAALWLWHRTASWLIGDFIDLEEIRIDLPLAGNDRGAHASFHAPVRFGQHESSLAFHRRYLDFPVRRSEQELEALLATYPAELLRLDAMACSTSARVCALLGADFSRELPGLEAVAGRLHMAPATLHRRLQSEGTTFQKLKDNCRRNAAFELLRDETLTGAQIATMVGFSDASTFLRAFRKWTGRTPAEFRRDERWGMSN
jgi:AraC-like DNA-binding protein